MDPLQPVAQVEVTEDGVEVYSRDPEVRSTTEVAELLPLTGLLSVENPGPRQVSQLKVIQDYFGKDAQGVGDMLHRVRQTELKMSEPRLGESRLGKLYNYVKLQNQIKQAEEVLHSL